MGPSTAAQPATLRAGDLGIRFGATDTGPWNAITDVPGVRVGHVTLIEGSGALRVGTGPVRTGVTVILPRDTDPWAAPVFAGALALNGNGEITGLAWLRDSGMMMSPLALTSTHSVGIVRDALVAAEAQARPPQDLFWRLPVVAETWDGLLNDINGGHITAAHVQKALDRATSGRVDEGNVGGGTGMICHGFKGGIGTSSRRLPAPAGGYTVGVLVQANHGRRDRLAINGVDVGQRIRPDEVPEPVVPHLPVGRAGGGSIVVVVATDAPLLPHQCTALAQRAGIGVGRTGGTGETWSGDIFIAFATGNHGLSAGDYGAVTPREVPLMMLAQEHCNPLYDAAIDATEEAIVNALLAAETMTGRDSIAAHGLDADRLVSAMRTGNVSDA